MLNMQIGAAPTKKPEGRHMVEEEIWSAIEKLKSLLVDEADHLQEVKELKNDLSLMLDFLTHSAVGSRNNFVESSRQRNFISQVSEIAGDAVVAVDTFISQSAENSTRRIFCNKIESLRFRLQRATERGQKLEVEGAEAFTGESEYAWRGGEDVVGLERDVKLLLREAIFKTRHGASIVCIVGMGGIGKTTLAREVYEHAAVADRFQRRAWVSLSSKFIDKMVFMDLILQIEQQTEEQANLLLEKMRHIKDRTLEQMLYKLLMGKSYFIVLDDVWEDSYWEPLLYAFPNRDKASRILITSRFRNITNEAQYIHEMKILDPDKSWQLFLKTVFASDHNYSTNQLEKMRRDILTKCSGLPVTIKEVGKQFAKRRQSEMESEKFLESMDLSETSTVLELSYRRLPFLLELYFLYLGLFKEGTTVRVEKLVQLWEAALWEKTLAILTYKMGEEKEETVGETARRYLDELINRSMVQVKNKTKDNRVKHCHINDIFHRLFIATAYKNRTLIDVLKKDSFQRCPNTRHRHIHCSREEFNYSTNQDKHLVSLFFHGGGNFDTNPSSWKRLRRRLMILDFEGFGLKSLPETVGELAELRYLGLRNNYIQELPRSLRRLKKLEVLDIAQNFMVEVGDIIWEMDSLRQLYISDIICQKPLKIDTLKHLHTLTYISVDNLICALPGLRAMTSLRKLGIEGLDENSKELVSIFSSLAKLSNLDCLILKGSRFRSMPSLDKLRVLRSVTQLKLDGLLTRLPSASNFPPNISYLTLVNNSLDKDPMPTLETLPGLIYLKLQKAYGGKQMVISYKGFGRLQALCMGELWHLRNVGVGDSAMQRLERLEINNCPHLETLPLRMITNLKELKMVTTKSIAAKARGSTLISKIPHVDIKP